MSKRSRSGQIAPNPNTTALRAAIAQRRQAIAAYTAVQLANQRAVRAERVARGLAKAEQVIAERPDLTADDYIQQAKAALDKADELLGIRRTDAPTDVPAGEFGQPTETQEPSGLDGAAP